MTDPFGGLGGPASEPAVQERPRPARRATVVLLGLLAAFFAAEVLVSGNLAGNDAGTLFRLGALYSPAVAAGEYFRLGSYAFLHIGWLHLAMNGAALWALMPQLEATYGPALALGLFSATALAGGAASASFALLRDAPTLAAGASGGIFGLFGATIALFWRIRHRIPEGPRRQIVRGIATNIVLNAAIALVAPVDNAAHLGGAVAGLALGLLAPLPSLPDRLWGRPARWGLIASIGLLLGMEGVAVSKAARPVPVDDEKALRQPDQSR